MLSHEMGNLITIKELKKNSNFNDLIALSELITSLLVLFRGLDNKQVKLMENDLILSSLQIIQGELIKMKGFIVQLWNIKLPSKANYGHGHHQNFFNKLGRCIREIIKREKKEKNILSKFII